ncbi:MAG: hypothetical protein FWF27_06415 [Candidatus Bathyarchaeota archaeon]|nr:hypothetical protein [Candidatus Termiticorpusculum sp.]
MNYKTKSNAPASTSHLCLNTARTGIHLLKTFLKKVKTATEATQNILLPKIKKEIDPWKISLNIGIISAQRKKEDEKQKQPPNLTDALQIQKVVLCIDVV